MNNGAAKSKWGAEGWSAISAIASTVVAIIALVVAIRVEGISLRDPVVSAVLERGDAEYARRELVQVAQQQASTWAGGEDKQRSDEESLSVQLALAPQLNALCYAYAEIRHRVEANVATVDGVSGMLLFKSEILRDLDYLVTCEQLYLPKCPSITRNIDNVVWLLGKLDDRKQLIAGFFAKPDSVWKITQDTVNALIDKASDAKK